MLLQARTKNQSGHFMWGLRRKQAWREWSSNFTRFASFGLICLPGSEHIWCGLHTQSGRGQGGISNINSFDFSSSDFIHLLSWIFDTIHTWKAKQCYKCKYKDVLLIYRYLLMCFLCHVFKLKPPKQWQNAFTRFIKGYKGKKTEEPSGTEHLYMVPVVPKS